MNRGSVQEDIHVLVFWERRGAAITKAVVLCLLLSPRVSLSNIRSADQQQYYGFPELNSWEEQPPPPKSQKGRMKRGSKCGVRPSRSMCVSLAQECVRGGEQEMRSLIGVSVVPALWKGMLQWSHSCRREHAYRWHNPHNSMLRPPQKPKSSLNPVNLFTVSVTFSLITNITVCFLAAVLKLGEQGNDGERMRGGNEQEVQLMAKTATFTLFKMQLFYILPNCKHRQGSKQDSPMRNSNTLHKCSPSGNKIHVSIESFSRDRLENWMVKIKVREDMLLFPNF